MIASLWKSRDRFPMGSGEWCRAWTKRFLQSPRLITQALAHGRLRRAGASVAPSALLAQASLMSGRLELLHFLREVAISIDYHRYGNLGMREGELRRPIL